MKAIGAKSRFILTLFIAEALFIGLIGSTFGILSGIGGAYILTSGFAPNAPGQGGGGGQGNAATSHLNPIFVPGDLFNVWILSTILSLGAGLFPAWKASRLSHLEALRR